MLARPLIFPDFEESGLRRRPEFWAQAFGRLLCDSLVPGCVAMGSAVFSAWEDSAYVRDDLLGQESIHGRPPLSCCRIVDNAPRFVLSTAPPGRVIEISARPPPAARCSVAPYSGATLCRSSKANAISGYLSADGSAVQGQEPPRVPLLRNGPPTLPWLPGHPTRPALPPPLRSRGWPPFGQV